MILHMLCLLMVMMMFNSVICAPGQMSRTWKYKPRPKSSGTLDSIGGGHLIGAEDLSENNLRSLELLINYKNDIPQDMVLVAREDKQKPSSSGTLDSIGGGNIVRIVDPEVEVDVFRLIESLFENQDVDLQNIVQLSGEDKSSQMAPNLDPIGGGNLVRNADSDTETEISRFVESSLRNQDINLQNLVQLSGEDKSSQMAPNLDPIGGGNLVRNGHSDTEISISVGPSLQNQDDIPQDMILVAREDKQKPSSSGTLDSIGGGNLVRIIDPENNADVFRELQSLLENQGVNLPNIVQLPGEDKSSQMAPNLDPLGGGNFVKIDDSDTETDISRSVGSSLQNQNDTPQDMISVARVDKKKLSSSGTLDPIGGGNLVRIIDPADKADVFRELESLLENQDVNLPNIVQLSGEDKSSKMAPNLDPLGGGNLVRNADSNTEAEISRSMGSSLHNQIYTMTSQARQDNPRPDAPHTLDPIGGGHLNGAEGPDRSEQNFELFVSEQGKQNMMRLAREDKSMQRSSHALDGPYKGQIYRSLERSHLVDAGDQGGDVQRMLDSLSASDLLSLDSAERMAVVNALRSTHSKYPKRMLDSVSGWAFGESKRNFDEIDNVGFTGFAKRGPARYRQLALAKKNFDEIDRAGFETYNKRDFDEIDRTGFDTFEKRDRKE